MGIRFWGGTLPRLFINHEIGAWHRALRDGRRAIRGGPWAYGPSAAHRLRQPSGFCRASDTKTAKADTKTRQAFRRMHEKACAKYSRLTSAIQWQAPTNRPTTPKANARQIGADETAPARPAHAEVLTQMAQTKAWSLFAFFADFPFALFALKQLSATRQNAIGTKVN